ncbi:MAG: dipeptidase [Chloroflexota bacterium]
MIAFVMTAEFTVFDGHNDVVLRLLAKKQSFFDRNPDGHIDLPRAREGGLAGGFCAMSVPGAHRQAMSGDLTEMVKLAISGHGDEASMPPTPAYSECLGLILEQLACLCRIGVESRGQVKIVRTAGELEQCLQDNVFAILLHMEGAEAIDTGLNALEVFYRSGLRSLGLVWSRPNAYGFGVPCKFGVSPDTGPGLTDAGKELVRACNRLRIVVDVSHLNEKGFWDVAAITDAPIVATHSNVHRLAAWTRNLTDRQLDAIRESNGMVGLNFHVGFLRSDGDAVNPDTPLGAMVQHINYLVERLGIDRVGFGSDFDGAIMPAELGDSSGLPRLMAALRASGYDDAALRNISHGNWVRVLRETWGA